MAGSALEVVVYTRSIPDDFDPPKAEILDRLRRCFEHAGIKLTVESVGDD